MGRRRDTNGPLRRRSQRERREETQAAVLEATVECLAEHGYSGTSTVRIAKRAHVSRGALLHYYSSKVELLTSAVEYLFEKRVAEFRVAFAARADGSSHDAATAVDILWEIFRGTAFEAWLELLVAARNDPELHGHVSQIAARFMDTVRQTYHEILPGDPSDPLYELVPDFAFAFLQGLALDRIAGGDAPRLEQLVAMLKGLEGLVLGNRSAAPLLERLFPKETHR